MFPSGPIAGEKVPGITRSSCSCTEAPRITAIAAASAAAALIVRVMIPSCVGFARHARAAVTGPYGPPIPRAHHPYGGWRDG